ncbi:MAG: non-ribosomal peptide synthetase, partial [bacterium]|nr:non-ribosomal peptide synthetase [bacterium]
DHQVKIRGFRSEIGEIESQLLNHEDVKEAAVVVKETASGDKTLCAYIAPLNTAAPPGAHTLKEYLAQTLPDYMIPPVFIFINKMPLTPNGKVDKKALPEPDISTALNYIPPRDKLEKELVELWTDILTIEPQQIGIENNFFELGGHSLKATTLMSRLHKQLEVKLSMKEIFKNITVKELAQLIRTKNKEKYTSIEPAAQKEYYPLSSSQKRLYILQQMEENNTGYNIYEALQLEGPVDKKKLEETFRRLITRHEALRTTFHMMEGEAVQKIHGSVEFEIEYHSQTSPLTIIPEFIRPFDLTRAPLMRVGLIKTRKDQHLLILDMHHIISDGTSMWVFETEFMALYSGEQLKPQKCQYKDYSEWRNREEVREAMGRQEAYWLNRFEGEIPVLNSPTDYPRPAIQQFDGNTLTFEINREEMEKLKTLALTEETTLFMVLLAIFNILLAKISGQEDIVVGTPIAGREHADLENVIGAFINTLALRQYPAQQKKFRDFLTEVKEDTLAAYENQAYPFEDLVEKVAVNRDASRNPLFDVMFSMQNQEQIQMQIPGLKLLPVEIENKISKFDLSMTGIEELGGTITISIEYCTHLFKEETIARFIAYFRKMTTSIIENTGRKISEIEVLPESEKQQLVLEFNNTAMEYPENKTILELFHQQVEKTPHHVSLVGTETRTYPCSNSLTYQALNRKADRLAALLIRKGATPGAIIGIMV